MKLRAEQMQALDSLAEEDFVTRACGHAREHFPEQTDPLDDAALRSRVRAAIAAGRSYKIESESYLIGFLELCLELGDDFHTKPWAQRVLKNPGNEEEDKIEDLWCDHIDGKSKEA